MYAAMVFFFKGLTNEFEIAVENEPSVFEPLKFYCKTKTEIRDSYKCQLRKVDLLQCIYYTKFAKDQFCIKPSRNNLKPVCHYKLLKF